MPIHPAFTLSWTRRGVLAGQIRPLIIYQSYDIIKPAAWEKTLMRLLHVDSSARHAGSSSRALSAFFVDALRRGLPGLEVDRLDVAVDPPPHATELFTAAAYTPADQRTPEMIEALRVSDALCDRVLAADAIVLGVPMYNFGMPSALKALVDNIVRGGRTYIWGADHQIVGQLGGRRVLFVTARGADFCAGSGREEFDALTPGLRAIFGFLGVTDMAFIDAQPLQFGGEDAKADAIARARASLLDMAGTWIATSSIREAVA